MKQIVEISILKLLVNFFLNFKFGLCLRDSLN